MGEWMPIETAPKDSTTLFLALRKSGRVVTARGSFAVVLGPEKPEGGRETIGEKWNGYVEDGGDAWLPITPTHWMPMPPPPKGAF